MNSVGNGEIFIQTWIPYSKIEFVLSALNVFMTKCSWYESTIVYFVLFLCLQDEMINMQCLQKSKKIDYSAVGEDL